MHVISLNALELKNKLEQSLQSSFFTLFVTEDCAACDLVKHDIKSPLVRDTHLDLFMFSTLGVSKMDDELLSRAGIGEFPFLALWVNGEVQRKWSGYFLSETEKERISVLNNLFGEAAAKLTTNSSNER
jgi:hypothetical protein